MYIDVRGPHPVLFNGMRAVVLHNYSRNTTVWDAVSHLSEKEYWELYAKPEPPPVLEDEKPPFEIKMSGAYPNYKSFLALWVDPDGNKL